MGLLRNARELAEKAYNALLRTGSGNAVSRPEKNFLPPNSIMNPSGKTVCTPEDSYTPETTSQEHGRKEKVTKEQIAAQMEKIEQKYKALGITEEEFRENILKEIAFSEEEFNKCKLSEQKTILDCIEFCLDSYKRLEDNYGCSKDVQKEAYIVETARNYRIAKEHGLVRNQNDYRNMVGDVSASLGRAFRNFSASMKRSVANSYHEKRSAELKNEEQIALMSCSTDAERESVKQTYEKRREIIDTQEIIDFTTVYGAEDLPAGVLLGSGKRLDKNINTGMKILSKEAKVKAADKFTFDALNEDLNLLSQREEDMPDGKTVGSAVTSIVENQSYEGAKQFESDSAAFRQNYDKGKVQADYLTKDVLNNITAAVAKGVVSNINMTNEQKTEVLESWNTHLSNLSQKDVHEIQKAVNKFINEYIKAHPEDASKIAALRETINKNCQKAILKNRDTKKQKRLGLKTAAYTSNVIKGSKETESTTLKSEHTDNNGDKKVVTRPIKATKEKLCYELKTKSLQQAKRENPYNTNSDFIEAMVESNDKKYWPMILDDIKTKTKTEDICNTLRGCSTELFCYILRHVPANQAGELFESRKDDMCYAGRRLSESILEG